MDRYVYRPLREADIPAAAALLDAARARFREQGIPQWQNGTPNAATLSDDVRRGCGRVLTLEGKVIATAYVAVEEDPTYRYIAQGAWHNTSFPYGVVHRITVSEACRHSGAATFLLRSAEEEAVAAGARSMRMDTHRLNEGMQAFLRHAGFTYCGLIYLADGAERFAYEKPI